MVSIYTKTNAFRFTLPLTRLVRTYFLEILEIYYMVFFEVIFDPNLMRKIWYRNKNLISIKIDDAIDTAPRPQSHPLHLHRIRNFLLVVIFGQFSCQWCHQKTVLSCMLIKFSNMLKVVDRKQGQRLWKISRMCRYLVRKDA